MEKVSKNIKTERTISLLKQLAAEFILLEASGRALITVTNARLSSDGKYATIYFTVFPEENEKSALDFVRRRMPDFRDFVHSHSRLGHMPMMEFQIDLGEKNRQRISAIPIK